MLLVICALNPPDLTLFAMRAINGELPCRAALTRTSAGSG
jgi:hypothetical protein